MNAYEIALSKLGLQEIVGPIHNEEIVAMFAQVGHSWVKDDETAWCAAFVGWALEMAGEKSTRKLNARSYLDWGVEVDPAHAQQGDIIVFPRGNSTWQGHVGFVSKLLPNGKVEVLSGNQRNMVTLKPYELDSALGVRRSKVAKPKAVAGAASLGVASGGVSAVKALEAYPSLQVAAVVAALAVIGVIIWKVRK